ncbi:LOW QUALITY PROTEIN: Integrase, catalytic core protein [Phytophthora megakarya]|uniref:Integrase, catalytic core protein n=1 Tax=Phytophthora megakarya TaxID=4795 RepID=A0A225W6E4_9STRA|nr:LOW QUALITY PROTEIN: Integrase, catalytic core protein [Phytophthora megakarya]
MVGKCFKCNRLGYLKWDCPEQNNASGNDEVFSSGGGATAYMTLHWNDLFEYEALDTGIEVTIADSKNLRVVGRGTVHFTGLDSVRVMMKKVLYIPGLDRPLLSVGKLGGRGPHVVFQRSSCVIWRKTRAIALGTKAGKAYILDCQQEEARFVQYTRVDSEWELWHARMGHCNENALAKTQLATTSIPTTLCGDCMTGKPTVTMFLERLLLKSRLVLPLVHTDVMGPMRILSKEGARYVLTIVYDYLRYVVAYLLKNKSKVAVKLSKFKAFYENQRGEQLEYLRSDNGTEYVNKKVAEGFRRNGIMYERTPSAKRSGGKDEMNVHGKARSMLHYGGVFTFWWAEAVNTAAYLIYSSTNTTNSRTTPYELGFKTKPRMDHLRVFGPGIPSC